MKTQKLSNYSSGRCGYGEGKKVDNTRVTNLQHYFWYFDIRVIFWFFFRTQCYQWNTKRATLWKQNKNKYKFHCICAAMASQQ